MWELAQAWMSKSRLVWVLVLMSVTEYSLLLVPRCESRSKLEWASDLE